ncbi:MAG: PD-(D/E)XK nuclease family protein [Thermoguttaceae bacterium]
MNSTTQVGLFKPEQEEYSDALPAPGIWSYISASRLNLWAKCPQAFKFRYIDGIKTPTNANLFLGKVVHAALEHYYRRRQLGQPVSEADTDSLVSQAWKDAEAEERVQWESAENSAKCKAQADSLIRTYIAEYANSEEKIVAMEASLYAPTCDPDTGYDLGVPLCGIVDLVLQEERKCVVVDFKTAASASCLCEQTHAVQLMLYSELLEANGYSEPETEVRQLIKTKVPKVSSYRFGKRSGSQKQQFFELCREYLDSLDRGVFNFRPGWSCSMCDYRRNCSA